MKSNQAAFSAAKMCRMVCGFGSVSEEPAGIRTLGISDRLTGKDEPPPTQTHRTPPSEGLCSRTGLSPRVQAKLVRDVRAQAKNAFPENFLHMVPWQWDMRWTGPLTLRDMAPQRQLSRIAEVKVVCFPGRGRGAVCGFPCRSVIDKFLTKELSAGEPGRLERSRHAETHLRCSSSLATLEIWHPLRNPRTQPSQPATARQCGCGCRTRR